MAQIKTAGVILAGGRSSRFGSNKALALYETLPLISHAVAAMNRVVQTTYIVHRTGVNFSGAETYGAQTISDLLPDYHPLGGIYSALSQIDAPSLLIAACDQPRLNSKYLNLLLATPPEYNLAVGLWDNAIEPLPGLYRKDLLEPLRELIAQDQFGIKELTRYARTRIYYQQEILAVDPSGHSFRDIDTLEDLEELSRAH